MTENENKFPDYVTYIKAQERMRNNIITNNSSYGNFVFCI